MPSHGMIAASPFGPPSSSDPPLCDGKIANSEQADFASRPLLLSAPFDYIEESFARPHAVNTRVAFGARWIAAPASL
jgi:hypothetical protein